MQFDKNVTEREVLITYMEKSGVKIQKDAAKLLRDDDAMMTELQCANNHLRMQRNAQIGKKSKFSLWSWNRK